MTKKNALWTVFGISIAGMLFSGYLSFTELFLHQCAMGGGCGTLLGAPVCVYGFVMYTAVLVVSILGLKSRK